MKCIIQIPCYNEEFTLPQVLQDLPSAIEGISEIEILIIDDGSTDRTVEVAVEFGVDHIVQVERNKGLANAFKVGLEACLKRGADIVVNTDGDNQYKGKEIPKLVEPVLHGEADVVIGNRQTDTIAHFSPLKKLLQKVGSWVVRQASNTDVLDATSGFRAYTREAAMKLVIFSNYTYTLETIIQAGKKNLAIVSVPIETNAPTRQSRLVKSNFRYVLQSGGTILQLFLLYEPLKTFIILSIPSFLTGGFLWGRYLVLLLSGEVSRGSNIQSIVVGSVFLIVGSLVLLLGLLGNIMATNRYLNEELLYYARKSSWAQR